MCLLQQVQVCALLPEFCTHEVGLPAHCELKKVELTRGVDHKVRPQVRQQASGQGVRLPRQISYNLGFWWEVLLEMLEKNFQNAVMSCVVSAVLYGSLAVTENMC